jgi:hypothetical protein
MSSIIFSGGAVAAAALSSFADSSPFILFSDKVLHFHV